MSIHDTHIPKVSDFCSITLWESAWFPHALAVLKQMQQYGQVVLVSDEMRSFNRTRSSMDLFDAVDGQMLIYVHKEEELDDIEALPCRALCVGR